MMMLWALLGAIFIGVSLGLLGSGGSITTVPILIYWVGLDPKVAFASSLAIVGAISAVSAISYAKKGLIDWRSVVWFGFPAMVGAVIGAHVSEYVASWFQLLVFAGLLLTAAVLMLRPIPLSDQARPPRAFWKIATDGVVVGAITGLVGVGGGFLIIPALVLLGGLSMSLAVGTSLIIIVMKAVTGFWEYLHVLERLDLALDWQIIVLFSLVGIVGGQLGMRLHDRLPQQLLRRIFAIFLLLIGAFIVWQNLPKLIGVLS
jgi:uncharacterized membrane protein YfcA